MATTEREGVPTIDHEEGSLSVSKPFCFSKTKEGDEAKQKEDSKEEEEEEVVIADAEGGVRLLPLRGTRTGRDGAVIDRTHNNTRAAGKRASGGTLGRKLWRWIRKWV